MLVLVLRKRNTCIPCMSANLQLHRAFCNNHRDTLFSYILVFNFLPVAISNYVATITTLVEVFNTCGFDTTAVWANNLCHNSSHALMIAASSASNRVEKVSLLKCFIQGVFSSLYIEKYHLCILQSNTTSTTIPLLSSQSMASALVGAA